MNTKNEDTMTTEKGADLATSTAERFNVELAAHMNVYAHALGAILTWDEGRVTEQWLELRNGIGPRRTPSLMEQIQEIATDLAEQSDVVACDYIKWSEEISEQVKQVTGSSR